MPEIGANGGMQPAPSENIEPVPSENIEPGVELDEETEELLNSDFTMLELNRILKNMKNNKASGEDCHRALQEFPGGALAARSVGHKPNMAGLQAAGGMGSSQNMPDLQVWR